MSTTDIPLASSSTPSLDLYTICDWLSAAIWPPFLFGLVVGLPSALLYTGQCCVIVANWKHFRSSYFLIFTLRAAISLVNYFCSYIAHRLGRFGLFFELFRHSMPGWLLALGTFVMYYSFHLENLTTALLLLNRFSSVHFPLSYERIWRVAMPPAFVLIILLPLPFTVTIFWLNWIAQPDIERTPFAGNNYSFTLNNAVPKDYPFPVKWSFTTTCAWSGGIFLLISFLLNCATIWAFVGNSMRVMPSKVAVVSNANGGNTNANHPNANANSSNANANFSNATNATNAAGAAIKRKASNHQSQQSSQQQRMERKLTIYTLATFVGQLLLALYMLLICARYFETDHDKQMRIYLAIFNQYGWVTDVCTVALPAWMLLWANKKSRDLLFGKSCWKKLGLGSSSTTTVPIAALGMRSWAHRRPTMVTENWAAARRPSERRGTTTVAWATNIENNPPNQ